MLDVWLYLLTSMFMQADVHEYGCIYICRSVGR